ncbi:aldehyde dehydrogenase family protein [Nocardia sp. CDC153]|uniref:aldehyde dehydrogenase family protein n=1 Tax=Nocardia sp. CDC153 TaxID=3112167 RepID=UPI002DBABCB2|nr:aldehyde dehydrogenase family protein [Nocardia sp. CDC153]MEC3956343.1 aldehyde dehydrogenase family protein [Nocardia sp. CDC153]
MTHLLQAQRESAEGEPGVLAAELVGRAREAQATWGALAVEQRVRVMSALPELLHAAMDRIAQVIVEENGKPLAEALAHEVVPAIALTRHHLETAAATLGSSRIASATAPYRKAVRTHRPYGVVVAIAPWNLPFLIPFSQVLPALIAGNAVVLKPSELTPRVAEVLVEVVRACGLPEGMLQLAIGDGAVGAALIEARPDKVLFTGSVATGRAVMAAASRFPIPVGLELGGIDAAIVLEDADLEYTTSAVAWGANFNGGQACCSIERVLVHESLHDAFVVRLEDKLRRIDLGSDLAPAIDERQQRIWQRHLAEAREHPIPVAGGEPSREHRVRVSAGEPVREHRVRVTGGEPVGQRRISPAVVSGEDVRDTPVWREETFGPVVAVSRFGCEDEAVALHNATEYGLTASVFSADVARARALAGRLRAGSVSINDVAATMYSTPELAWGGVALSGFGRSHGVDALLDASWVQVVDLPRGPAFGPKRPWWFPYDVGLEDAMRELAASLVAPHVTPKLRGYGRAGRSLLGMLARRPKL